MMIFVGDKLLDVILLIFGENGFEGVFLGEKFVGCKVVIFVLSGVYIGVCLIVYVLSFICIKGDFDVKGVDEVICIFVNDLFVMKVWGEVIGVIEVGFIFLGDV